MEQPHKFLDPKTAAAISNYRLMARLIIDGFFIGQHRGPRHAFSLEYSKHREYYPGDSLKLVDWKLFAKSDRYFVKQFEEETNLQAWMLMDISKSMTYQGSSTTVSKLDYACYLAGALSYLLLGQKDLTGMMLFDSRLRKVIPPSSASKQLDIILRELRNLKPGDSSSFEAAARHAASRIKKRGLIILFSDLMAPPEEVERTLKQFLQKGNELIVFHVLSHDELKFPFRRFSAFQDMETHERVLLQPDFYKAEYQKQVHGYLASLKQISRKLKISYQMLETTTPFDRAIQQFLEMRNRMH